MQSQEQKKSKTAQSKNTKTGFYNITNCYDAPPLDYSYRNVTELKDLQNIEPRLGTASKQKPKLEEKDTKSDLKQEEEEKQKQADNDNQSQKEDEAEKPEGEEGEQNVEVKKKDKKEEKKAEEKNKQPEIIRVIPAQQNQNQNGGTHIIVTSGGQKSGSGKLYEEKKQQQQKKIKINLICTSLILSYNQIRSLDNFPVHIGAVMTNFEQLQWLDLSHNYLVALNYDFKELTQLKSLYLHCNYIKDISELLKLQHLPLISLTIHGNPIDTIPGFRLYIVQILPQLKRIDSVLISNKERDNSGFLVGSGRKLPKPLEKAQEPPEENQANNNEAGKSNQ
eukprot:TRINITY_DN5736_c0_g1_i4.p1 TRINITY_DN5736_c0_g1~~TRINITY_DN5736_c0_g1_i4.p1  ORF type:complete len:336 (-),score=86.95 TRINITY_DN5736_c0_g1_i4:246-1253(-)